MRWSIEELVYAWKFYKEHNFMVWFIRFPKNTWRRIKLLFHWIFTGYTRQSLWNLDKYLIDVIIFRLIKFRKSCKNSYPAELASVEDWNSILDDMIDKFIKCRDDYYSNQEPLPKPIIKQIEVKINNIIKVVRNISFESNESEDKARLELYNLQDKNDREALELFCKYLYDLWD